MPEGLIANVCKLLGVEIGEKFNVKRSDKVCDILISRITSPAYIDEEGCIREADSGNYYLMDFSSAR